MYFPNRSRNTAIPSVKVYLYSNEEEFTKFYNQFLTLEDLTNSVASQYSMPGFSEVNKMFNSHDGYAITIEADFLRAKRD